MMGATQCCLIRSGGSREGRANPTFFYLPSHQRFWDATVIPLHHPTALAYTLFGISLKVCAFAVARRVPGYIVYT